MSALMKTTTAPPSFNSANGIAQQTSTDPAGNATPAVSDHRDEDIIARVRRAREALARGADDFKKDMETEMKVRESMRSSTSSNDSPSLVRARAEARLAASHGNSTNYPAASNVPAYRLRESRFVPKEQYGRAIERSKEMRASRSKEISRPPSRMEDSKQIFDFDSPSKKQESQFSTFDFTNPSQKQSQHSAFAAQPQLQQTSFSHSQEIPESQSASVGFGTHGRQPASDSKTQLGAKPNGFSESGFTGWQLPSTMETPSQSSFQPMAGQKPSEIQDTPSLSLPLEALRMERNQRLAPIVALSRRHLASAHCQSLHRAHLPYNFPSLSRARMTCLGSKDHQIRRLKSSMTSQSSQITLTTRSRLLSAHGPGQSTASTFGQQSNPARAQEGISVPTSEEVNLVSDEEEEDSQPPYASQFAQNLASAANGLYEHQGNFEESEEDEEEATPKKIMTTRARKVKVMIPRLRSRMDTDNLVRMKKSKVATTARRRISKTSMKRMKRSTSTMKKPSADLALSDASNLAMTVSLLNARSLMRTRMTRMTRKSILQLLSGIGRRARIPSFRALVARLRKRLSSAIEDDQERGIREYNYVAMVFE
ncbi:hypothetical protein KC328_g109 [Hortaea werneckii]|nr:hypothetical protein KC328_g109 [Hortaea werneckii]